MRLENQEIWVELGERRYPILIAESMLNVEERTAGESVLMDAIKGDQVMVITNETIEPLYLKQLLNKLKTGASLQQVDALVLPDGEQYKRLSTIEKIYDELMARRHSRTTTLIALGGGVIGDMAGFAAATYQRGVGFVQIPTTLLAQVDSSVGGKTGVNHPKGKNMIGAFYQPRSVLIDLQTLQTLSDRDYQAGLAEVVKYGLIWDQPFFEWLEDNAQKLMERDAAALQTAIKRSCEIKAEVVRQDEREGGIRAILNLGHTFGHAIETATNYTAFLHGEAVAIGMLMAVKQSQLQGWLAPEWSQRLFDLLTTFNLPVKKPDDLGADQMKALMYHDKKVVGKTLRLVLLKACGQAVITSDFDESYLNQVLNEC